MIQNKRSLVLNADYLPFSICGWQKAFILLFKKVADEVDFYNDLKVRDCSGYVYPVPSIIRLHKYIKNRNEKPNISKRKLFIRDSYLCAYCGKEFNEAQLTMDHIVPRSQKGTHDWLNLITACLKCNLTKRDRTPEKANMPLLYKPSIPTHLSLGLQDSQDIPPEWDIYINRKKAYAKK